ncbi:MAG: hypothetical protein AB1489_19730 [Acidobacteriota bacterium]
MSNSKLPAKMYKHTTTLLEPDHRKSLQAVAQTVESAYLTVAVWRNKYKAVGL